MIWKIGLLLLSNTLLIINAIYLKKELRKTKYRAESFMKKEKIAWEKYALKANEADNLRKRINQTYNKPIF